MPVDTSKETEAEVRPRYPGFDKYPGSVRVTFTLEDRELLLGGGPAVGQELGLRYAKACQELGAKLGIEPTILAEAYTDPCARDVTGVEVSTFETLQAEDWRWPVTFEFPKQRRKHNLLLGLEGSGKTTLLHALRRSSGQPLEEHLSASGHQVETLALDDFTCFTAWDLAGPHDEQTSKLLEQYREDAISVIFVVDASDADHIERAQQALAALPWESALGGFTLLVYANKQDLVGALPAAEIAVRLQLSGLPRRKCNVQSCCATTGDGVFHGIHWLSQAISAARSEEKEQASFASI